MSSAVTDELFSLINLQTVSEEPRELIDFSCQLYREYFKKKSHCSGNVV